MDDQAVIRTYGNTNLPEGTPDRPLVTFALFAYNQEKYIREAVEGAFSQTYSPLEIILSDDCSSDRTYEIMQEMVAAYEGPHRVILRRNPENRGLARHVNKIIELAGGTFIALAAGDDVSLDRRVEHAVAVLRSHPGASFHESGCHAIDRNGKRIAAGASGRDTDRRISLDDLIGGDLKGLVGAARTYRMSAIEKFPPLLPTCPTEDSTFVLRCLMVGTGDYAAAPDVNRRIHDNNLSGASSLKSMNYAAIWQQYRTDARHALDHQYISGPAYASVMRWISRTALVRTLQQRSQHGAGALLWECFAAFAAEDYKSLPRMEVFSLSLRAVVRYVVKR